MTETSKPRYEFGRATIQMVDAAEWRKVIENATPKDNFSYYSAFERAAEEAIGNHNDDQALAFRLLEAAFSFMVRPAGENGPYIPRWAIGNCTTPLPDDFESSDLDVFIHLIEESDDPVFKARLADIVWTRRKHQSLGLTAVESYLASAQLLQDRNEFGDESRVIQYLERACQISRSARLDKEGPSPCAKPLNELRATRATNSDFFSYSIFRLIFQYRLTDDPKSLAEQCEQLAQEAADTREREWAERLLEVAVSIWLMTNELERAKSARLKIARIIEDEYEGCKARNLDPMLLGHHCSRALQAYRMVGHQTEKTDALERELKMQRKESLKTMKAITAEVDASDAVSQGRALVANKDALDSLIALSRLPFPSKSQIETEVREQRRDFPLLSIIPKYFIDDHGNLIANPPSMLCQDPSDAKDALEAEMYSRARMHMEYYGSTLVDAARIEMMQNTPELELGLKHIVTNNPFIPSGREEVYFRGLKAGFESDWLICTHLLIPQLEHSIRTLIERAGKSVTSFDRRLPGIQREDDLGTLLYDEGGDVLSNLFSQDILFELRVLLIDSHKQGFNLRHALMHGLYDPFLSRGWGNYFLWLVLRLIVWSSFGSVHPLSTTVTKFDRLSDRSAHSIRVPRTN